MKIKSNEKTFVLTIPSRLYYAQRTYYIILCLMIVYTLSGWTYFSSESTLSAAAQLYINNKHCSHRATTTKTTTFFLLLSLKKVWFFFFFYLPNLYIIIIIRYYKYHYIIKRTYIQYYNLYTPSVTRYFERCTSNSCVYQPLARHPLLPSSSPYYCLVVFFTIRLYYYYIVGTYASLRR